MCLFSPTGPDRPLGQASRRLKLCFFTLNLDFLQNLLDQMCIFKIFKQNNNFLSCQYMSEYDFQIRRLDTPTAKLTWLIPPVCDALSAPIIDQWNRSPPFPVTPTRWPDAPNTWVPFHLPTYAKRNIPNFLFCTSNTVMRYINGIVSTKRFHWCFTWQCLVKIFGTYKSYLRKFVAKVG